MGRTVRLVQVPADRLPPSDGPRDSVFRSLSGYLPDRIAAPAPAYMARAWSYAMVEIGTVGGSRPEVLHLAPVGRLVPRSAPLADPDAKPEAHTLRPVQSGQTYRIVSPPARGLVRPDLAEALETVFERFAREHGFTAQKPLEIALARGFKAGSHGHGEGRAADIAAVGGKSILEWKQDWDRAATPAAGAGAEPGSTADAPVAERQRNLGYGLYKALQAHSGWRVNEAGWRPYLGVIQLFGPWTASEGPWRAMRLANPTFYQRQRLGDQRWVFRAHQDHIHAAR